MLELMDDMDFTASQSISSSENGIDAIDECCCRSDGDERVHVRSFQFQRFKTDNVVFSVHIDDRQ